MHVTFLGATRTVTGSRTLVETERCRILVDCGLYQGRKDLRLRNWEPFPVPPAQIDAVVLTHAHVDHCGYLPALVRDGFRGTVLATAETEALAGIVLPDSGRLHEEEARTANRRGYSKHRPALPLYTEADATNALTRFQTADFDAPYDLADATVTLRPSGHILGSASVAVAAAGRTIVFSGDLGRPVHPLLDPPAAPPAADAIVVESTYGSREHDEGLAAARLGAALAACAHRGGVAVIPAFAVDRTEVVLHLIASLMADGTIPDMPVYVDSPMALRALSVYRAFLARGSEDVREEVLERDFPLEPPRLTETRQVDESKALNDVKGPAVIISASGMATGGRVLHHLLHRLSHPENAVILVGYQAAGTRGRRLLDGEERVKMLGQWVPVRASIVDCAGLSVHAGRSELLAWLGAAPTPPAHVFVNHGEEASALSLADAVTAGLGIAATAPELGDTATI